MEMNRKEILVDLMWRFPVSTTVIGSISTLCIFLVNRFFDFPSSWSLNIIGVFFFIVLLASYLFLRSATFFFLKKVLSGELRKELIDDTRSRLRASSSSRVGLLMLSTVIGAFLFVALNAGLVSMGL